MADLKDAGAVGIGDDAFPVADSGFMRRAMEYCRMLDLPFLAHCEDKALTGDGVMNEGYVSTVLGLKGIPRSAENVGTARNVLLAMATGCHLHVLHVSTKESVEIIRHAKKFGAPVTCETCPQYVALTDEACYGYDTNAKMSPPLRTAADQDAIIAGPGRRHDRRHRDRPRAPCAARKGAGVRPRPVRDARPGNESGSGHHASGQARHPDTGAGGREDVHGSRPAFCAFPAARCRVGAPADITVFDPDAEWTVDVNAFKSKSRNSVFARRDTDRRPRAVARRFVGGRQI